MDKDLQKAYEQVDNYMGNFNHISVVLNEMIKLGTLGDEQRNFLKFIDDGVNKIWLKLYNKRKEIKDFADELEYRKDKGL